MTSAQETRIERTIIVRLAPSEDILESLEGVAAEYDVRGAQISFIGAVAHATLGYFDLKTKSYKTFSFNEDMEVTSGIGNISRLDDGTPIVHAHLVVANERGNSYSGHLMRGCIVSVTIEIVLNIFKQGLLRVTDERTGLNLLSLQ